ncbi:asparagine synthase (glutamine-hydrolyzing) [Brumimicrobium aurantiacum]|uniref:asparagine synthase (glutamine-hydrolyzing) n=1 Tax=Brumimicrobium aurantiacum TaxID=1737063 RepID=A0A3E1F133_9FLAO|nr:asparagine synthase (glutamine-hydrolyzing) [Brumimicrobium aurantiacum]RFC55526.1 asparagine synthase (glutamine-hydrolyzing) [Brumimicrobium aurantiacum]
MCGIVGLKKLYETPKDSDKNRVDKALLSQHHRGPDNTSNTIFGQTVLGHNRLAIIDLNERSNQPFFDASGRYAIIFNGEIYNYPELKNKLLQKEYIFQTSSDTEVLLYHMIEFGADGIDQLEGCFAFSFYDQQEDEMILARDHMGINPLLFSIQEEEVLFASELSAFKYLLSTSVVNEKALNAYFQFTYVPAPETMIVGVHKLLPGHYLKVKKDAIDIVKYYSVRDAEKIDMPYDIAVKEVRNKLETAVIKRLNADVPVGTFLSGGVDSSVVSQITAGFKTDVNTFSIGFVGNDFFDESEYAKNVAKHINSIHHPVQLAKEDIVQSFKEVMKAYDEPFADSSAIAMYFLSRAAKKEVTVCLSGDGADEIFAGYNKHKAYIRSKQPGVLIKVATKFAGKMSGGNRRGKMANKVRQLKKFGNLLQQKWPNSYWMLAQFISLERRNNLLLNSQPYESVIQPGTDSLQHFLMTDQQFVLPNDMLKKVDMMSMNNSLEVRTPFLDRDLVDFVNGLPDEYKYHQGVGKRILRDAFRDSLPDEVFSRSKKGFEVPLQDWIQSVWSEIVDESWFSSSFLEQQDVFSKEGVDKLKSDFDRAQEEEATVTMWAYIVFQNWYKEWTEK